MAIPASLQALLANLIDYAGLYPPAALPLHDVAEKYAAYRASPYGWMLNRLVLPAAKLAEMPLRDGWETLETKLAHSLSLPTYCEAPLDRVTGAFAKVRTGGLAPDAVPAPAAIANFLRRAAHRRLPFKATAGLHHPLRSLRPLTDAAGSPRPVMHGFVNFSPPAAFACHDTGRDLLLALLTEEDPRAFEFAEDALHWRGRRLSTAQIQTARRDFAHSFGSCSFEGPAADLRTLGYLRSSIAGSWA